MVVKKTDAQSTKVGAAKCDQSYNKIIKRRTGLIVRLYNVITRHNAKINDLNAYLDELLKAGRITKEELVERFKRPSSIPTLSLDDERLDEDTNPFLNPVVSVKNDKTIISDNSGNQLGSQG